MMDYYTDADIRLMEQTAQDNKYRTVLKQLEKKWQDRFNELDKRLTALEEKL